MTESDSTASASEHSTASAQRPTWTLVFLWGPAALAGKRWLIDDTLVIGRGEGPLPDEITCDPRLSRRHAELQVRGDDLFVHDLGSHNGTKLNGQRLTSDATTTVAEGDVLQVGNHAFVLQRMMGLFRSVENSAFAGSSQARAKLLESLNAAARTTSPVLLTGACGTGKTLAADELHRLRTLAGVTGPLVTLYAATVPPADVHTVLFGQLRDGMAVPGLLVAAENGTLVVDRLDEAAPALQSAIAAFLESGLVRPAGQVEARRVPVGIVATTVREASLEVELATRFTAWRIEVPSLARRVEDIPALASRFLESMGDGITMTTAFVVGIARNPWPGNVRGLFSFLERAVLESEDGKLDELPQDAPPSSVLAVDPQARIELERSGAFLRVGTSTTSLVGRRMLRVLLAALIESAERNPDASLGIDALFAVGWPGERVQRRAGASRVYVGISSLRKLGLAEIIERTADGYRLAVSHRVGIVRGHHARRPVRRIGRVGRRRQARSPRRRVAQQVHRRAAGQRRRHGRRGQGRQAVLAPQPVLEGRREPVARSHALQLQEGLGGREVLCGSREHYTHPANRRLGHRVQGDRRGRQGRRLLHRQEARRERPARTGEDLLPGFWWRAKNFVHRQYLIIGGRCPPPRRQKPSGPHLLVWVPSPNDPAARGLMRYPLFHPRIKMNKQSLVLAGLVAGSMMMVSGSSSAQSSCGSSAKVASAIWAKVGSSVKAKGCKNVTECMAKKDKWEETIKEAIAFWNEQAGGSWATIGPRPLLVDGAWNDGKVVLGGERLFISRAPSDDDEFTISVTKEAGGGADVFLSTFDGTDCALAQKVSFEKSDKKNTVKTLRVKGAKGKIVIVKVDADGTQAFDYKFRAAQ